MQTPTSVFPLWYNASLRINFSDYIADPQSPPSVSVTITGDTATVSWPAPAGKVSSYNATVSGSRTVPEISITDRTFNFTVQPGGQYDVTVVSVNSQNRASSPPISETVSVGKYALVV